MRRALVRIATVMTLAVQASAGDAATYTRFLVPLYVPPIAGAHGSRWEVSTWVYYGGSGQAFVVPPAACGPVPCTFGSSLFAHEPPIPVEPFVLLANPAVLFHVEASTAGDVVFASRVRDLSRQAESAGTAIPVVHEDRILARPLWLLDVPVRHGFRNMLRIYALPEVAEPEVEIRYYRMPDPKSMMGTPVTLLHSQRMRLRTYPAYHGLLLQPSQTEVAGFESFAELASEQAVWVEVVPVTAGLRIWAFVSTTNNETQEVTVIAPPDRAR